MPELFDWIDKLNDLYFIGFFVVVYALLRLVETGMRLRG